MILSVWGSDPSESTKRTGRIKALIIILLKNLQFQNCDKKKKEINFYEKRNRGLSQ